MTVFGSTGNDTITANSGSLTAALGNGNNLVTFGAGSSTIYEGTGMNTFVINAIAVGTTRTESIAYYKPGQDAFQLGGGLVVSSQHVIGNSLQIGLSDGSSLNMLGVNTINSVHFS